MGTKSPKNSEQISISDSDCEIQEIDLSSITIPDSPETTTTTTTVAVLNIDEDDHQKDQNQLEVTTNNYEIFENLLFEVNFKNDAIFNEYKDLVLKSLKGTLQDRSFLLVEDDTKIQVFRVNNETDDEEKSIVDQEMTEIQLPPPPPPDNAPKEVKVEISDSKDGIKPASDDENLDIAGLFMIDTKPAEKVEVGKIPSYKRTIKEILNESSGEKKKKTTDEAICRPKRKSCFNCDGTDHDLRSCPKPRNNSKINKAKKAMVRKERYHVDIEQRFAHLRPGQVSKQLREALGIGNGELPFFFYRMRVLGYPPGWLEDARVAHSGITLFDSEGRSVRDEDEEEGEVDLDKNKYDVSKIIAFPGFNSDPGPNFYDDFQHHNVPPMNVADCRERFIEMLGDNVTKGYKRKKLKNIPDGDIPEKNTMELSEMEIEDSENTAVVNVEFTRPPPPPSPPKDTDAAAPPPPPPPESPQNKSTRSPSPTLEDLEEKQRLLRELLLQSSAITISDNDDSLIDEVLELETDISTNSITSTQNKSALLKIKLPDETESSSSPAVSSNTAETDSQESTNLPQTNTLLANAAMESVLGTPLLKFSPFDKLPNGDNFKVGVSDVINFENLPDSTGTYEKMKGVIKKVRTIVTKLNSEDS